jgi:hypothetical protein
MLNEPTVEKLKTFACTRWRMRGLHSKRNPTSPSCPSMSASACSLTLSGFTARDAPKRELDKAQIQKLASCWVAEHQNVSGL